MLTSRLHTDTNHANGGATNTAVKDFHANSTSIQRLPVIAGLALKLHRSTTKSLNNAVSLPILLDPSPFWR